MVGLIGGLYNSVGVVVEHVLGVHDDAGGGRVVLGFCGDTVLQCMVSLAGLEQR